MSTAQTTKVFCSIGGSNNYSFPQYRWLQQLQFSPYWILSCLGFQSLSFIGDAKTNMCRWSGILTTTSSARNPTSTTQYWRPQQLISFDVSTIETLPSTASEIRSTIHRVDSSLGNRNGGNPTKYGFRSHAPCWRSKQLITMCQRFRTERSHCVGDRSIDG